MRGLLLVGMVSLGCGGSEAPPVAVEPEKSAEVVPEAPAAGEHFGAAFTTTEAAITASALLDDPSAHVGKTIRVEGRVADVCQKAGCWMVISDENRTMRVLMKDHDFSVAKDGAGSWATIEGTVVEKANDKAEAEHFASESAKPELAPEAAAGERKFELVATAVEFKRG